jgi:hypothetical protein
MSASIIKPACEWTTRYAAEQFIGLLQRPLLVGSGVLAQRRMVSLRGHWDALVCL